MSIRRMADRLSPFPYYMKVVNLQETVNKQLGVHNDWEMVRDVGDEEMATVNLSKDSVVFGALSVGKNGYQGRAVLHFLAK